MAFISRHGTIFTRIQLLRRGRRNKHSRASVIASLGLGAAGGTYGDRLRTIDLVLESIAAGSVLTTRFILRMDCMFPDLLSAPENARAELSWKRWNLSHRCFGQSQRSKRIASPCARTSSLWICSIPLCFARHCHQSAYFTECSIMTYQKRAA
jgi:hypothetical protein